MLISVAFPFKETNMSKDICMKAQAGQYLNFWRTLDSSLKGKQKTFEKQTDDVVIKRGIVIYMMLCWWLCEVNCWLSKITQQLVPWCCK